MVLGRVEKKVLRHLQPGAEHVDFLLGLEMSLHFLLMLPSDGPRAWGTEPGRWGDF